MPSSELALFYACLLSFIRLPLNPGLPIPHLSQALFCCFFLVLCFFGILLIFRETLLGSIPTLQA
jgi:hypothetical protein